MSQEPKRGHFAKEKGEVILREHEYDGIQEFDQKLPNWWLFTFYGAVIFAVCYWFYYEGFEVGASPMQAYAAELAESAAAGGEVSNELIEAMAMDPSAVAAGRDLQEATRRDEPGCLAYTFAADPVVPTRMQVYELWENEASLAAHFNHPNYFDMREVLGRFERVGFPAILKYRCDLSEPVYDRTFTPRADFFTAE